MPTLLLTLLLAAVVPAAAQETRKVPSDSVELEARGCFKGRVFTATTPSEEERTRKGPDITGRHFRVTGEREVMDLVKRYDGQFVELVGIVEPHRPAAVEDERRVLLRDAHECLVRERTGDLHPELSESLEDPLALDDRTARGRCRGEGHERRADERQPGGSTNESRPCPTHPEGQTACDREHGQRRKRVPGKLGPEDHAGGRRQPRGGEPRRERTATRSVGERGAHGHFYVGEIGGGLGVNYDMPNIGPRISIYSGKGELLSRLGNRPAGLEPGQFVSPHGLAVDSHGDIYVVRPGAWGRPRRIVKYVRRR